MNLRTLYWRLPLLLPLLLLVAGCQGVIPTETAATAVPAAEASTTEEAITINFALKAGDQELSCTESVTGLGLSQSTAQLNDLRFYISNLALVDGSGNAVPVTLTQDGLWQVESTALLDFEDGSAGCTESGNPDLNTSVQGTIAPGDYTAVRFDLGVPFELNHLDVTVAPSPLNVPPMWWNWQFGYKFVRIDMKSDAEVMDGAWFIHLGSTGCMAEDQSKAPTERCSYPNVATIQLDGFDPATNTIVADLATLLANVDLAESVPQPPGCMSGPDDPDCAGLLPAFGLDIATGACPEAGCPTQTFFRVE
ncbi:MAG: metallo-mystery pair system four-Cys motif protein [Caldilineaceae bacterium]|nr:metallo-mystery pair system four-Cys motif protein [Caldilineaceae bacterium]